jgi:hypothetical protein
MKQSLDFTVKAHLLDQNQPGLPAVLVTLDNFVQIA